MIRRSFITYLHLQNGFLKRNETTFTLGYNCICGNIKKQSVRNVSLLNHNEPEIKKKDITVQLKNDPDTFGPQPVEELFDSDDEKEEKFLQNQPLSSSKLSIKQYSDIIKKLLKGRKIQEAIDVLEVRMLKEDRVKPETYIYSLLIGACGRVGYTKKAFSLFNNLKKRGLKVHASIYTSLFNACANSPWALTDGLSRAKHLRSLMIEKQYEPNDSNYNAMIKAFGRCGEILTAFELVDEMISKKYVIKADTLNFLLQACISDKNVGFRHALLVWHKFIKSGIHPDIFTFNLMLRCIRDCNIGDLEAMKNVIENITNNTDKLDEPVQPPKLIESRSENVEELSETSCNVDNKNLNELMETVENRPNLMAENPHLGNIIALSEVKTPQDRLLLVGGLLGFLETMKTHDCTPDIKTFTQLLDNIPSSLAAEKELLQNMKKLNVKPDIDFFNMLIKKRNLRFDHERAWEVLTMFDTHKYRPNVITYGVLALGCETKEQALSLISKMKSRKYRLNIEILGAMLSRACYHNNFPYVLEIMELCLTEDIKPSKIFMNTLEEFKKKSKKISNDNDEPLSRSKSYQRGYKSFKMRYKNWVQEVSFEDNDEIHPWDQFRKTIETDVKHFKDKSESTRFKKRHTSVFRQKTSKKALEKY